MCVYMYVTKISFDILLSLLFSLSSLMVPRKFAMQFVQKAIGPTSLIHPQDWHILDPTQTTLCLKQMNATATWDFPLMILAAAKLFVITSGVLTWL